VNTDNLIDG